MQHDLLDDYQQTSLRYYYNLTPLRNATFFTMAIVIGLWGLRVAFIFKLKALFNHDIGNTPSYVWYAEAIDEMEGIIGFIMALSMVFFFMWLYRAFYNLEHIRLKGLTITAGWAVGWFFIPIVNIFYYIPTILNVIVRGSKHIAMGLSPMQDPAATPSPPLGVLWTISWLVGSVVGNMADQEMDKGTILAVNTGLVTEAISNMFFILSGFIAFYIVFIVSRHQHKVYTQEEPL